MNRSGISTGQWVVIGVGILLLLAIFSPQSVTPLYAAISLVTSVVSIAFYALGALWFYRQLNQKEKP